MPALMQASRSPCMALAVRATIGVRMPVNASRLRISDHTVGHHFQAIYAKLGVTKRSQLIALLK